MEWVPISPTEAPLKSFLTGGPFISGTVHKIWKLGQRITVADLQEDKWEDEAPVVVGRRPSGSVRKGKTSEKLSTSLADLVVHAILVPGRDKLTCTYKGTMYVASLGEDGSIDFEGRSYHSPTAWSIYVKRLITPDKQGDDGWKSVLYDGRALEHFRREHQALLRRRTESGAAEPSRPAVAAAAKSAAPPPSGARAPASAQQQAPAAAEGSRAKGSARKPRAQPAAEPAAIPAPADDPATVEAAKAPAATQEPPQASPLQQRPAKRRRGSTAAAAPEADAPAELAAADKGSPGAEASVAPTGRPVRALVGRRSVSKAMAAAAVASQTPATGKSAGSKSAGGEPPAGGKSAGKKSAAKSARRASAAAASAVPVPVLLEGQVVVELPEGGAPGLEPSDQWVQCERCQTWRLVPNEWWAAVQADDRDEWHCEDAQWDVRATHPHLPPCRKRR